MEVSACSDVDDAFPEKSARGLGTVTDMVCVTDTKIAFRRKPT